MYPAWGFWKERFVAIMIRSFSLFFFALWLMCTHITLTDWRPGWWRDACVSRDSLRSSARWQTPLATSPGSFPGHSNIFLYNFKSPAYTNTKSLPDLSRRDSGESDPAQHIPPHFLFVCPIGDLMKRKFLNHNRMTISAQNISNIPECHWKLPWQIISHFRQPHPVLSGTFDATNFGPSCLQRGDCWDSCNVTRISEDCLTVSGQHWPLAYHLT